MRFQFRLQAVLTVRQHERDILRQTAAADRCLHSQRVTDRDALATERGAIMDELRQMNESTEWSLEQVIERQRHADQLGLAVQLAEAAIEVAAKRLASNVERLVIADQSVQSLEKLAERQFVEFQKQQARSSSLEFDDSVNFDRRFA